MEYMPRHGGGGGELGRAEEKAPLGLPGLPSAAAGPFWPSSRRLDEDALDHLFRAARTRSARIGRPVSPELLEELYALVSLGPTSANCSPARFIFVVSDAAKARLAPHVASSHRDKVGKAPVCVIIGYDLAFAEHLVRLFPHAPGAGDWFKRPDVAHETAFRNGALQGAYMILAARALGLDADPISEFDGVGLTGEFFPGARVEANFLCSLGDGADEALFPRLPRPSFGETATLV